MNRNLVKLPTGQDIQMYAKYEINGMILRYSVSTGKVLISIFTILKMLHLLKM